MTGAEKSRGLVAAADGSLTARYDYGPSAEHLPATSTGTMAKRNPFRFSTKYTDDQSGLVYYGYRYCIPSLGKWISRDPITEKGGPNVYCFLSNQGLSSSDVLGLKKSCDGTCGPDVGAPTARTLLAVEQEFWRWSTPNKYRACSKLVDALGLFMQGGGVKAWDILELYAAGSETGQLMDTRNCGIVRCGTGQCARTVTVNSGCYYASAVNYSMWGLANRLCSEAAEMYYWPGAPFFPGGPPLYNWDLDEAIGLAVMYKIWLQDDEREEMLDQVASFTTYGYSRTHVWREPLSVPSCLPSECKARDRVFRWYWKPVRPL